MAGIVAIFTGGLIMSRYRAFYWTTTHPRYPGERCRVQTPMVETLAAAQADRDKFKDDPNATDYGVEVLKGKKWVELLGL